MSEETVNGIKIRYWLNTDPCFWGDSAATGILDFSILPSSRALAPTPVSSLPANTGAVIVNVALFISYMLLQLWARIAQSV